MKVFPRKSTHTSVRFEKNEWMYQFVLGTNIPINGKLKRIWGGRGVVLGKFAGKAGLAELARG